MKFKMMMAVAACSAGFVAEAYAYSSYGRTDRLIAETQEVLRQVPDFVYGATQRKFQRMERGVNYVGGMTNAEFLERIRESARRNNSYWKW